MSKPPAGIDSVLVDLSLLLDAVRHGDPKEQLELRVRVLIEAVERISGKRA